MIRPAVCADAPGIYTLICALEETRFPQEIFMWELDIMLGSPSHILLVSEEQGDIVGLLHMRSRPTRACELKSIDDIDYVMDLAASRPTRACELK